jgi:type I restriction enzyme S subunit
MDGMAASHDLIRAVPNDAGLAPGFLFAFLSTPSVQSMIQQRAYGSVVQHIEPHHIHDLPVPLPPSDFEQRIQDLIIGAARARSQSESLLLGTTAFFAKQAGPLLKQHEHAHAMGVVCRSSLDYRLDAFYHVGWAAEPGSPVGVALGEIASVTRPAIVGRVPAERGVPFVSGIDVYQVRPSFRQRIRRNEAEVAGSIIREAEILVQRGGQRYGLLGRPAYAGKRIAGWAASEDLMHVKPHDPSQIGRLFGYLQSDVGRRNLLRTSYGTSIPKLNTEGLSRLIVPDLPLAIATQANRALRFREEADAAEQQAIDEVEAWLS